MVIGDLNGRIGRSNLEDYPVGKFGEGTKNGNGQIVIDFCNNNNQIVTNTIF